MATNRVNVITVAELKTRLKAIAEDRDQLKRDLLRLREATRRLRERYATLEAAAEGGSENSDVMEALQTRAEELSEQLLRKGEENQQLKNLLESREEEALAARKKIEDLGKALINAESHGSDAEARLAHLERKQTSASQESVTLLERSEEERRRIGNELQEAKARISAMDQIIQQERNRRHDLENAPVEASVDHWREKWMGLERHYSALLDAQTQDAEIVKRLQTHLAQLVVAISHKDGEIAMLASELEAVKEALEHRELKLEKLDRAQSEHSTDH